MAYVQERKSKLLPQRRRLNPLLFSKQRVTLPFHSKHPFSKTCQLHTHTRTHAHHRSVYSACAAQTPLMLQYSKRSIFFFLHPKWSHRWHILIRKVICTQLINSEQTCATTPCQRMAVNLLATCQLTPNNMATVVGECWRKQGGAIILYIIFLWHSCTARMGEQQQLSAQLLLSWSH